MPDVAGAVVPTVTFTSCAPLPLICTEELDRPQVGAGVTAGVMTQPKFTVPLKESVGAMTKLKFAVFPALTVWEVGDPEAGPIVKSGGASPSPSKLADCGLPGAVSLIERLAIRDPAAVGSNVTFTAQLPPIDRELPQLLISEKSEPFVPVILIPLRLKGAFPVFTSLTVEGLLLVPTSCDEKFCRAGNVVKNGPLTPLPLTGIAKGLIRVLSVILIAPDCRPIVVGEKVTLTAQLAPGLRLAPQLLVSGKLILELMLAMSIFTLLEFLIVIVWRSLIVPTPCEPKLRELGEIDLNARLSMMPTEFSNASATAKSTTPSRLRSARAMPSGSIPDRR